MIATYYYTWLALESFKEYNRTRDESYVDPIMGFIHLAFTGAAEA
jgi:hypothetical protein